MTPEQVLSYPPRVLSQAQREFYFDNGYLEVKGLVDSTELEPLQRGARQLVERSRHCSAADVEYVVAAGHSAEHINLRRHQVRRIAGADLLVVRNRTAGRHRG